MNFWKVVIDELEFQNKTRKWLAAEASFDVSTIGTGLFYDSRDNIKRPLTGTFATLDLNIAGIGGNKKYYQRKSSF